MADLTHREVLESFDHDWRTDADNRDDALEDLRFKAGDQWKAADRKAREDAGRPCLTVNRMRQFVLQIANDIRQMRPSVHVLPVDGESDPTIAGIYEGLIRQIEYRSKAHIAYGHGAEDAISCGIGHWRITSDYVDDSTFDQEIRIKQILDPLSVVWDAAAVAIDRSDARHCFVIDAISDDDFKLRFGKFKNFGSDMPSSHNEGNDGLRWREDDHVRIAEYFYLKAEKRTLIMTQDGATIDITDFARNDVAMFFGEPRAERKVDAYKVCRQLMDGEDYLGESEELPGRFIPIVPVVGAQVACDGKVIRSGIIRDAKDPQRLYNIWRSSGAEVIGASPKAPWLVTFDMVKGLEGYWSNANRSNLPYLPYNVDPQAPTQRPERQAPPTAPQAMWAEAQVAADDMKATTGIYDAALGAKSNETSGVAIRARDLQGDTSNYHFADNLKAAIMRTGEILVDMIPRIYDAERMIRILGPNDEEQFVAINAQVEGVDGPVLINDLSHGRFDVRVDMGPSYSTARQEAQEMMAEAMKAQPALWQIIGDLYFKNSDYPGSEEIAERMKKAMPPEIIGEEEGEQPQEPDPMARAMAALEMAKGEAEVGERHASTQLKQAQAAKTMADAQAADPAAQMEFEAMKAQADHMLARDRMQGEMALKRDKIEADVMVAGMREAVKPDPQPKQPAQSRQ